MGREDRDNAEIENKQAAIDKKVAEDRKKVRQKRERLKRFGEAGQWFQTICWINIPIIGFLYIIKLAVSKKTPPEKQNFARGYLIYRILVFILAITVLYCLYRLGLGFIDGMLDFVK